MSIDSSFESEESFASDSEKSPETLEREIDAQRSSISNIVDALESKFSAGQLLDQALSYTKGNGGEFFGNLGNTIKANPVPTVLTSVGLLWLMMGQNSRNHSATAGASSLGHLGEQISSVAHTVTDTFNDAKSRIGDTAQRMKEKAAQVTDKASHLGEKATQTLSETGQTLNSSSDHVTDTLQQQARKAQSGLDYMLREQPLAVAAIGIALGAVIGAALPSTDRENRIMGQASDDLTEKAKSLASEGYEKVSQFGKEAVGQPSGNAEASAQKADLSSGLG